MLQTKDNNLDQSLSVIYVLHNTATVSTVTLHPRLFFCRFPVLSADTTSPVHGSLSENMMVFDRKSTEILSAVIRRAALELH